MLLSDTISRYVSSPCSPVRVNRHVCVFLSFNFSSSPANLLSLSLSLCSLASLRPRNRLDSVFFLFEPPCSARDKQKNGGRNSKTNSTVRKKKKRKRKESIANGEGKRQKKKFIVAHGASSVPALCTRGWLDITREHEMFSASLLPSLFLLPARSTLSRRSSFLFPL